MDDSERPTLETEGPDDGTGWKMPEPIYRSTPGHKPGQTDHEADIRTEAPDAEESIASQSVRVKETPSQRHKKKKGGCAKFFTLLAVIVGLLIGSAIVAVIYFLFYYRGPSTTF